MIRPGAWKGNIFGNIYLKYFQHYLWWRHEVVGGELDWSAGQSQGRPHHGAPAARLEAGREFADLTEAGSRDALYGELSAGQAVLEVGQRLLQEGDKAGLGGGVKLFL